MKLERGPRNYTPSEICADAVYTLEEFERRMGLSAKSRRQAQRNGLIVHRMGRRSYIVGRDFINFLAAQHRDLKQPVAQ